MNEGGIDPATLVPIRHYDGTPITARFISRAIMDVMSAPKAPQIHEAAK
jgi:2-oxoglutarate ferredoxin oxidoreductase subunit alpha